MARVKRSWSGDGLVEGKVVPAGDLFPGEVRISFPARPGPEPRTPGMARLMWRHHGPFIRPFLLIGALWLDAAAAHDTSTLAVRLLLTAGPAAIAAWRVSRRTRKGTPARHRAVVSLTGGSLWLLLAGTATGPAVWMVVLLLAGGLLLAGTHAHEARHDAPAAPPADEPDVEPVTEPEPVHVPQDVPQTGPQRQATLDEDGYSPPASLSSGPLPRSPPRGSPPPAGPSPPPCRRCLSSSTSTPR
jgi:hypothetical protein